jgi:transcriptional regulator with XRE-family HTH domain
VTSEETHRRAIASSVVKLLRAERERKGLSMNVLAAKAGLSQQTVSYVEREMRNPTLDTLLRISAVLDVDLGEILRVAGRISGRKRD